MNAQVLSETVCRREDLAAYIDGELSPHEELELEMHLAACENCAAELNEQKKMLRALSSALENERELELPADFTKVVVASAESHVSGLRHPSERFRAFVVCAALFLLIVLGLSSETNVVLGAFWKLTDQILAVFGFFFHMIYNVVVGITVILRALSYIFVQHLVQSAALVVGLSVISLIALTRYVGRWNRLQKMRTIKSDL